MNVNLLRTILAVATFVASLGALFGCDPTGTVCTASWLTPKTALIVTAVLGAAHVVIKFLAEGVPGLVAPVTPVDTSVK